MGQPAMGQPSAPGAAIACQGLLFDCDGVLVDSDASVRRAWSRWARCYGLPPDEVTQAVHGRRSADTVALLIEEDRRAEALARIDRYEVEGAATVTAVPGAEALLRTPWSGSLRSRNALWKRPRTTKP